VGKKIDGVLQQGFLYRDAIKPVVELDGSGNVVSRFVYGSNPITPDYVVRGGSTYKIFSDQIGSPRVVVDVSSGSVVERIDYDERGNTLRDTNAGLIPFGFAGGIVDRDTGLIRFGARDYDPSVGRWATKDASLFHGGINLYEYANDDQVNFFDRSGYSPEGKFVGWLVERGGERLETFARVTHDAAVAALRAGEDVLFKRGDLAKDAAEEAGGMCPIHDEAHQDRPGFHPHYHLGDRSGGHAFYSAAPPVLDFDGDGQVDWRDGAEAAAPWTPFFEIPPELRSGSTGGVPVEY
jgi:RHS repeat-associated protein